MEIFKRDLKVFWLKQLHLLTNTITTILLVELIVFFFKDSPDKFLHFKAVYVGLLLLHFGDFINKQFVKAIRIDAVQQECYILTKSYLSGSQKLKVPLSDIVATMVVQKGIFGYFRPIYTLKMDIKNQKSIDINVVSGYRMTTLILIQKALQTASQSSDKDNKQLFPTAE